MVGYKVIWRYETVLSYLLTEETEQIIEWASNKECFFNVLLEAITYCSTAWDWGQRGLNFAKDIGKQTWVLVALCKLLSLTSAYLKNVTFKDAKVKVYNFLLTTSSQGHIICNLLIQPILTTKPKSTWWSISKLHQDGHQLITHQISTISVAYSSFCTKVILICWILYITFMDPPSMIESISFANSNTSGARWQYCIICSASSWFILLQETTTDYHIPLSALWHKNIPTWMHIKIAYMHENHESELIQYSLITYTS